MEERMGCAPKRRLGRDRSRLALCGHPRVRKAWMAGTRPAMTIRQRPVALFDRRERRRHHESILLLHDDAGRVAGGPLTGCGGGSAYGCALVGVPVGPD